MASSSDEDIQSEQNDWEDWRVQDDDSEQATYSLFDDIMLPTADAAMDYDASSHGFDLRKFRVQVRRPCPLPLTFASPTTQLIHARTLAQPPTTKYHSNELSLHVNLFVTHNLKPPRGKRHCCHSTVHDYSSRCTPGTAFTHPFNSSGAWLQARLDDYNTIRCVNYIRLEVAAQRDPLSALAAAAQCGGVGSQPWEDDQYMQPSLGDDALLFHEFDDVQPTCESHASIDIILNSGIALTGRPPSGHCS